MPRFLIQIEDKFFEWSTVVDAPVSYGMDMEELESYTKERYGEEGLKDLPQRLERVKKTGCSSHYPQSVDELIKGNRAGDNEKTLTKKQIYKKYSSK